MPYDKSLYPDNWDEIALRVKDHAGWICEHCGKKCREPGEKFDTHKRTATVSHLNHEPMDCRAGNLRCLCAPCHLKYDAKHHAKTRAENARKAAFVHKTLKSIKAAAFLFPESYFFVKPHLENAREVRGLLARLRTAKNVFKILPMVNNRHFSAACEIGRVNRAIDKIEKECMQ